MNVPGADVVVVRHGDIGVKSSRVQSWMEATLATNLEAMLAALAIDGRVEHQRGRLFVRTDEPEAATAAATDVFGVVSASPARAVDPTLDAISEALTDVASRTYDGGSFAVDSRRAGEHDFTSQDVGRVGGEAIWRAVEPEFDPRVDLDEPDHRFAVEVRDAEAFVYRERVEGPGGLPVGTQDPLVVLVSGGIDSPVAGWLAMKRGAPIVPLYLDLGEYGGADHRSRAIETVRRLAGYAPGREWTVRVAPIGQPLGELEARVEGTRMLSVRRLMFQVAAAVADETGARGIVTGEAMGQKSSQTVKNLAVTDRVIELPIHRPLLSFDKQEIIERAREIGTYDTATIEAGCNRIAPDNPETGASLDRVEGAEPDALAEWAIEAAAEVELIPVEPMVDTSDR